MIGICSNEQFTQRHCAKPSILSCFKPPQLLLLQRAIGLLQKGAAVWPGDDPIVEDHFFFHSAPPSSGNTNRFARMSMIRPASTTRPKRCVGGKSDSTKMAKPAAKITSE